MCPTRLFHPLRSGATALALEGIFGDQVVQRGATHPKVRCCAGYVTAVLGEGALNEVFLKGCACLAEPFAVGEIFTVRGVQVEIGWGDLWSLRHQYRPFDPVLEFPHIPWPIVGL